MSQLLFRRGEELKLCYLGFFFRSEPGACALFGLELGVLCARCNCPRRSCVLQAEGRRQQNRIRSRRDDLLVIFTVSGLGKSPLAGSGSTKRPLVSAA